MAGLFRCFLITERKVLKPQSINVKQPRMLSSNLVEVGHFEDPSSSDKSYEPGQLFIHKLFTYRGVVLFPWYTQIFDNDIRGPYSELEVVGTRNKKHNKEGFYYQVLIDSRDRPFVKSCLQNEAVTFLGNSDTKKGFGLHSLPGMDYVSHEDILPYTSTTKGMLAIHHELFYNFFNYDWSKHCCFSVKPSLKSWYLRNSPWLDLSQVFIETTEDIRVTAIPFYIGFQKMSMSKKYWWRYMIRLENMGKLQMQLRTHHWRIAGSSGLYNSVRGLGVVGQEPFLCNKFPVFQYNSHVSLYSPAGHMWGTYEMERENGKLFECLVPLFTLNSKDDFKTPTTVLKDS